MAVQIPFPLPSTGFAMNSKVRVNLDFLVDQFNQFNTGTATWDQVAIGIANNETGTLTFYNASNPNYLTFKAGATSPNTTFTWPVSAPSTTGKYLTSTTGGVMSWSFLSEKASYTGNELLYADGLGVIQEVAVGSGNRVLVNSSPPVFFDLLGTTNQITVTPNVGNFTLSLPQSIDMAAAVQFGRVKVDAGTYASPGFYFASSTANTVGLFAEANGTGLNVRAGASAGATVFSVDSTGLAVATLELRAPTIRATTAFKVSTSTGSIVTIQGLTSSFGDYTLTLPPNDGTLSGQVLTTDGSGVLTWATPSGTGATTALDNLAAVAINASLLAGSDNSIDLGSNSKNWRSLYVSTSIKNGSTTLATATELGYLTGVTSAIQTQFGLKAPLASPTFTGTVTYPTPFTLGAVSVTATGTEMNYLVGVTSLIQTQFGLKAPLASPTFTGIVTIANGAANSPSFVFGDATTGFFRQGTNRVSIATNALESIRFGTTSTADDSTRFPIEMIYGGGSCYSEFAGQTTTTITTAKAIFTLDGQGLMIVVGSDGTNQFMDLLLAAPSKTPVVVSSMTVAASPTTRTYSTSSNVLQLAMSAGTYTTNCFGITTAVR